MKKLILFLSLPMLLFTACQTNSYYNAMNTNEQRFDGWQEDNAVFMNEAHDLSLLISDLSGLAKKKATLKETYLLADEVQKMIEEMEPNYKIEATILRIKLASSLSDQSDLKLHKLEDVSKENFDSVYIRFLQDALNNLKSRSSAYMKEGHNKRLIEFAGKLEHKTSDILKVVEGVEIS
ncbi:MAG: DUF4142 domain-containing protein [Marinoscillum sp.]